MMDHIPLVPCIPESRGNTDIMAEMQKTTNMADISMLPLNKYLKKYPQVAAMALNHTELAEMCGHLLAAPIIPDYVMTIIQVSI